MELVYEFFRPVTKNFVIALLLCMVGGFLLGYLLPQPYAFIIALVWGFFIGHMHVHEANKANKGK